MDKRPTIAELEAILEERDVKVEILPNGEVCAAEPMNMPNNLPAAISYITSLEAQLAGQQELFKVSHRAIKEVVEDALGREMVSDAYTAVHRLAQEFNAVKARLAEQEERTINTLLTCVTWRCTSCGTVKTHRNSTQWRMNGQAFEHQCAGPQVGCFPAQMMSAEDVAELTTP